MSRLSTDTIACMPRWSKERPGSARSGRTHHSLTMKTMRKLNILFLVLCFASSSTACHSYERSITPQVGIPANCLAPPWPKSNVRLGEPPSIDLALFIDLTGAVLTTRIVKSTGAREFDNAARTALAQCRYLPLLHNGKPVHGWVQVHYQWS